MTVREVARRLEVSTSLAYRLIAGGKLHCCRFGMGRGVIRVSEEQLDAYRGSVEHGRTPDLPPTPRRRCQLKHLEL